MSFGSIFRNLDWSYLGDLLLQIIPALLCIMVHEICHGAAAYALGDRTAATQGRLSLNPLRHVDWFGLLMLAFFHFGWARPVSVDIRNFKHPKRDMALTALAGPASNFVMAALALFLCGLLFRALNSSTVGGFILDLLNSIAYLSVSLGLFNLIPFPPLDGSRALYLIVSYCFGPAAGERAARCAALVCSFTLAALGAYLALRYGAALFLFAALGLLLPQLGLAKPRGSV